MHPHPVPRQTPPKAETPLGRHNTWADTPKQTPPPGRHPPGGHCSRRFASYWNTFLLITLFVLLSFQSVPGQWPWISPWPSPHPVLLVPVSHKKPRPHCHPKNGLHLWPLAASGICCLRLWCLLSYSSGWTFFAVSRHDHQLLYGIILGEKQIDSNNVLS